MRKALQSGANILPRIVIVCLFFAVFLIIIAFARGYRYNPESGKIMSTGILSINSSQRAAKVYVNNELKGVTDLNLTLPYGRYTLEVKKDGYTDWKKTFGLKGETVMTFDARLFPRNPSLTPLTNLGIVKALPLGNTDNMLLVSQSGDPEKDGIYLFSSTTRTISIFPPLTTLLLKSALPKDTNLASLKVEIDPNFSQAILTLEREKQNHAYLISLKGENTHPVDVTGSEDNILTKWREQRNKDFVKIIEALPASIKPVLFESTFLISLSPNEKRLMYVAKRNILLPIVIAPPLIGSNQSTEQRKLEKGKLYIYDIKEDRNYLVPVNLSIPETEFANKPQPVPTTPPVGTAEATVEALPFVSNDVVSQIVQSHVLWYPTSDYLAIKENQHINMIQYDGENQQTVYAGPFDSQFFAVSSDGNLLVVINLNPSNNRFGDLYSLGMK